MGFVALVLAVVALLLASAALVRGHMRHRGDRVLGGPGANSGETEPRLSAKFYFSPDQEPIGPNSGVLITNRSRHSVHEITVEALPESNETGGMPRPSLTMWDRDARLVSRKLHLGTVQAGQSAFVAAIPQPSASIARLRVTCRKGRREWAFVLTVPVQPSSQWR
jgi:hypothetical protein